MQPIQTTSPQGANNKFSFENRQRNSLNAANSTRSATDGDSSVHASKPMIMASFMNQSHAVPSARKDLSGPGTQAGTGEQQEENDITLKYFSSGPFVIKRSFVSPRAKIIEKSNLEEIAKTSVLKKVNDGGDAGTGSDLNYLKD